MVDAWPAGAHPAMVEAEEVEVLASFPQLHDPRLRLLERQAQLGQDGVERLQGTLGLRPAPAHHDQIVGVAHQDAAAARLPDPVKPVQVDVGKQRRDHPTLRGAGQLRLTAPCSITPARSSARSSFSSLRSQIRSSTAATNRSCGIASKQEAMSVSTTQRRPCQA
jgi:hypothetical protein